MRRKILTLLALVLAGLWLGNTSLFGTPGETRLLAHRGVYQRFDVTGVGNDDCTATRIATPVHGFIENTLPSMAAAFEAGAEVVEIDIHLTPDGVFAVFHDWELGCRTDGEGVTEETQWPVLTKLDVGYGYTADGGATFPLRGNGTGMMPRLEEVLEAFPEGRFLVNFKSNRVEEGVALARFLDENPVLGTRIFGVYGGTAPTRATLATMEGMRGYDKGSVTACMTRYFALGWSGHLPDACRDTLVVVPINYAPFLWGWPHRLTARMRAAGSEVILIGPYRSGGFTTGIDSESLLDRVPDGFDGLIWTNAIEDIGPRLQAR